MKKISKDMRMERVLSWGIFFVRCRQWCSQNHNFRDQDLVKTSRERLHKKSRG